MDKVQDIKTHLQILKSINKTIVPTFNQKVLNESILENTNTKKNIIKYIKIINNKRPCIGNKEEYQNDINVLI